MILKTDYSTNLVFIEGTNRVKITLKLEAVENGKFAKVTVNSTKNG